MVKIYEDIGTHSGEKVKKYHTASKDELEDAGVPSGVSQYDPGKEPHHIVQAVASRQGRNIDELHKMWYDAYVTAKVNDVPGEKGGKGEKKKFWKYVTSVFFDLADVNEKDQAENIPSPWNPDFMKDTRRRKRSIAYNKRAVSKRGGAEKEPTGAGFDIELESKRFSDRVDVILEQLF